MWVNALLMLASCTPVHRGLQKNKQNNQKKPEHVKHTHKLEKEEKIT
jgi:starvation-inducible outer membrane lipoprotein